jgi:hypothetical protein
LIFIPSALLPGRRRSGGVGEAVSYGSLQHPYGCRKPRQVPRRQNAASRILTGDSYDCCGGIAGASISFLFPQLSLRLHKSAVIRRKFVQTFAFLHFHYKEFYHPLSIDMFPILRRDFWPFSQLLLTLHKFIIQIFII